MHPARTRQSVVIAEALSVNDVVIEKVTSDLLPTWGAER
jgi:hypothetical protein